MNAKNFYRLDTISVLDVVGSDAKKIVHNLTTNEVTKLDLGNGCESFITDVRGKTLGHVLVYNEGDALRLIGAGGQSQRIAQHVDRYTIREEAEPVQRDQEFEAVVLPHSAASLIGINATADGGFRSEKARLGEVEVCAYPTPWLAGGAAVLLLMADQVDAAIDWLSAQSLCACDEREFHQQRVLHGFPWYGVDLDDKNLPQEADRDTQALSLVKGCYLGQETVARLDALGQVQKKLVRWSIVGSLPAAGATLTSQEKTVGRLTSVASGGEQDGVAIGFARRSHFDAGSTAEGIDQQTGKHFTGRVM